MKVEKPNLMTINEQEGSEFNRKENLNIMMMMKTKNWRFWWLAESNFCRSDEARNGTVDYYGTS